MPKYKDIAKQKGLKKERKEARLRKSAERMAYKFFHEIVYGFDK